MDESLRLGARTTSLIFPSAAHTFGTQPPYTFLLFAAEPFLGKTSRLRK